MSNRTAQATEIVKKYSLWSAGAGLIPIPFADLAVMTGVQIKMAADLAQHYGVPFDKAKGRSVIGAIVGGVTAYSLFHGVPGTMARSVPILNLVGLVSRPVIAAIVNYGVGSVFITHFEKGGTLDDLDMSDPELKGAYEEGLRKGRESLRSQVSPV